MLLKNFKHQMKFEQQVQGKPLFPMKESMFTARWKTLKDVKDHNMINISHSGHLMEDDYKQRERQMKELLEN